MAEEKKTEKAKKAEPKKEVKSQKKSARGFYHYIKQSWKKPSETDKEEQRKKMVSWRAAKRIVKLEKPSRLDKARTLGYKAKRGILVYRISIKRGGKKKSRPTTKRRSKRFNIKKVLHMNYQWIAEQRFQHNYPSLEVLNSYLIGKDGKYAHYEIIAIDPNMPEIRSDKQLNWICKPQNRKRAFRGLTSAGKKARGLRSKSHNLKVRPSARAWGRKGR